MNGELEQTIPETHDARLYRRHALAVNLDFARAQAGSPDVSSSPITGRA